MRCACRNIRFSPCLRQHLVPREVAVLVVAGQRKAEVRQVHADLVRAAGVQLRFEQRQRRIGVRTTLRSRRNTVRAAAPVALDAHAPLAVAGHELVQRQLDRAHRVAPLAAHQHEIALVDPSFAQLRVQPDQRRALLGDQQDARRVAVEPVDQLQELAPPAAPRAAARSGRSDAAAAVDGEPGRLVQRDQRVVLEQDRRDRSGGAPARARPGRRRRGANRRTRSASPDASRASGPTRAG